ncbi:MAG: TonB-dependent receptor plug domain-containing protein [Flavobacteriales bacterium]
MARKTVYFRRSRSILTAEALHTRRIVSEHRRHGGQGRARSSKPNDAGHHRSPDDRCRCLGYTEALQLVPGLAVGRDVDDALGVALHGNWAEEGKCLFLLNGIQLNENDFGTYTLGQRIPLQNVERIEVIIGPGSIVHGGYAALGVVNIVTYSAEQQLGTKATVRTSGTREGHTRTSITVSGSHRLGADQEINYLLSNSNGQRSNATYTLPNGDPIDLRDSTGYTTSSFQFNYRWKEVKAYMHYLDETFDVSDGTYTVHMRDILLGVEQGLRLGKRATGFWRIAHADQLPWYYMDTDEIERLASNTTNQRTSATFQTSWQPISWLTLRGGAQGSRQHSAYRLRLEETVFRMNGAHAIEMIDASAFGEASLHGKPGNLTIGHRVQHNSLSGMHTAPRIAYTKVLGKAHAKIMWSQAFRIPTVMNLNYGPEEGDVIAERIATMEGELGFQVQPGTTVTTNVYRTRIKDPIVYVYDEATLDNYINRGKAGTEGIDLRIQVERGAWNVQAGTGLYRALAGTDLPEAMLPEGTGQGYQGLPSSRAFAALAWTPVDRVTARLSGNWRNRIWSFQMVDEEGTVDLVEWPDLLVVNTGIQLRPDRNERWTLDLGCYNLLDQERPVLSPFNNVLIPYQQNGREWSFAVTYRFVQ